MFSFDENRNSSCDILNIPGNIHEIFHKNYEKLEETFQSRNRVEIDAFVTIKKLRLHFSKKKKKRRRRSISWYSRDYNFYNCVIPNKLHRADSSSSSRGSVIRGSRWFEEGRGGRSRERTRASTYARTGGKAFLCSRGTLHLSPFEIFIAGHRSTNTFITHKRQWPP